MSNETPSSGAEPRLTLSSANAFEPIARPTQTDRTKLMHILALTPSRTTQSLQRLLTSKPRSG